jgi:peroxiredoxin (alkyl hydroperoxide reductase subunit C)
MATIGQAVPEGTFQAFHEGEIRPITLKDYREQWLVLVFYPGDFTFICPTELDELGALYRDFR